MPGQSLPRPGANLDNITFHNLVAANTSANGSDQSNVFARGITVIVDITAITGTTPTLTVTIEGKDPVSGKYYTLLASTALNAVGTTALRIYPGLAVAANSAANLPLPKTYRVRTTIGGTTPAVTAKISGSLHI